jgi:hypothetical protein
LGFTTKNLFDQKSSMRGVFVGYNETSKDYRIFSPTQRMTMASQDVKFEEDLASRKSHETLLVTKDEEWEPLKVESRSSLASSVGIQPSNEREERSTPFSSIGRPR